MQTVFNIILLVSAVFLVVSVLMQSGKSHHLSGTIAGGAETFFGKTKGKTIDKILSKLTTVVAIVFTVLVIVVYVIQPDTLFDPDKVFDDKFDPSGSPSVSETVTPGAEDGDAFLPDAGDVGDTSSENDAVSDDGDQTAQQAEDGE